MPEFNNRQTGEVNEHNPTHTSAGQTHSHNPEHLEGSTQTAHDEAHRLSNSWMHSAGDHYAVLWTKGHENNPKGTRYEGSHVSPTYGDKSGLILHGGARARKFENHEVAAVSYVQRR
jgi:hypothetical protein